jgi:hypothetical protein
VNSTIELNGKRYDARTGKIISDAASHTSIKAASKPTSGAVLDGFTRRAHVTPVQKPLKSATKSSSVPKQAVRKLEKAQTLMRPAVKKPAVIKNDIQAQKHIEKPKHINLARQARAGIAPKSPHISKFGTSKLSQVIKKELHLPVATPANAVAGAANTQASNELQRIEQAIAGATSHLQQLEKDVVKKARFLDRVGFRNRFANLATVSLSVLLLAGFFAYQNIAAIEMRVAAARSGVSAQMPGYKPAGYGVEGAVNSTPGKVSVSFKSRTDNKKFTIIQQSSNWNSTSLLANHVSKASQPYQTYQNDGKTVYIFDNSNATWVNGGVWYQVEGDASLTSDQLLRLANSF